MIAPACGFAAGRELYDPQVIVVGAGPAGATAAFAAARGGLRVLLVDKARFPREKVCGCCLSFAGVQLLRDAGLASRVAALKPREITAVRLRAGSCVATPSLPAGWAVKRGPLDAALVEAAVEAGASFIDECRASVEGVSAVGRHLRLQRHGRTWRQRCELVIAADGLGGCTSAADVAGGSRLGLSTIAHDVPHRWIDREIVMCCHPAGYVGMVRLNDDELDVAAAFDPSFVRESGGAAEAVACVLRSCGMELPGDLFEARFRGTPLLTRRAIDVAPRNMLCVGDAAGYVEPFTGEGLTWAIASGLAAGELAASAIRDGTWNTDAAAQWRQTYRRLLSARQRRCSMIAQALRHGRLSRVAVAALGRAPWLAAPLIRRLNAPLPLELAPPRT